METQLAAFKHIAGSVVNLAAAAVGNAVVIYTAPTYVQMLGSRTIIMTKLRVQNLAGGNTWLYIGNGVGGTFAALMPAVYVINNLDSGWQEVELPRVESLANITAYPATLVAAGSLNVQLEVELKG